MLINKWMSCLLATVDPFDLLTGPGISKNASLRGTAASWYNLMMTIGIIGLVCTLIIHGLRLAFSHKGDKKSEAKSALGFKTIIAIGMFSFTFLAGVVYKIIVSIV